MVLKTLRTSALKIWAKIKKFQPWENPNVRYRTILHVGQLFEILDVSLTTETSELKNTEMFDKY